MEIKETDIHVLYLTERCNLNCKYCYERGTRTGKEMTDDVAKKAVDTVMSEYAPDVLVKLLFFGGEVTLNWKVVMSTLAHIDEHYYSKGRLVHVVIITNGVLLKRDKVKQLYKYHDFISLEISIDGDKETHDANRQFISGVGSHDIVIKNAKFALQYFPFINARLVIADPDKYYQSVVYLHKQGFKRFIIQALQHNEPSEYIRNPLYNERFNEETLRVSEYLKCDKFARLENVYPLRDDSVQEEGYYNYFLADGGRIKQFKHVQDTFQHFSKGVNASYNLLKGD